MRVLGIIAEYNPFHNGHRYHLEQSMAITGADCSVAVMSGNFLQRGEPAMWDKRLRAKIAVENGVDLVVELPFVFACNNAEQFAYGGVSLLNGLGCVTDIAFGCEGKQAELQRAAERIAGEDGPFKKNLLKALGKGLSYPAARTEALAACGEQEAAKLLTEPNNILAAEYLKQCILTGSKMTPHGILRQDGGYNSTELPKRAAEAARASAKAIRGEWTRSRSLPSIAPFIPEATKRNLAGTEGEAPITLNDFYLTAATQIRRTSVEELSEIYAVSEGMENLMKKAVITAGNMEDLLHAMKSKRYTLTRLQRTLIQTVMGLTKSDYSRIVAEKINYGHILAFSGKGAKLLGEMKKSKSNSIPIYSNLSKEVAMDGKEQLALKYDLLASDLYHIVQKKTIYATSDMVLSPFIKKY